MTTTTPEKEVVDFKEDFKTLSTKKILVLGDGDLSWACGLLRKVDLSFSISWNCPNLRSLRFVHFSLVAKPRITQPHLTNLKVKS
jgi:hypothetical protein